MDPRKLREAYFDARQEWLDKPDEIVRFERRYTDLLLDILLGRATDIDIDFSIRPRELLPFWINYPPEQRGRQPTGTATPMLELGEKTLSSHLIAEVYRRMPQVRFPGLPTGGDIRFATEDAYVHLDIKLTGPNDNPNEIVVPPNQVSGDGAGWENDGVVNSSWPVLYNRGGKRGQVSYHFQPKLSPVYILESKPLLCLTFFLKAVYEVGGFGDQPLSYLEFVSVPNGLIMFESYRLASTAGLIIPGKDERSKADSTKRVRIRLDPLSTTAEWRATKVSWRDDRWVKGVRTIPSPPAHDE